MRPVFLRRFINHFLVSKQTNKRLQRMSQSESKSKSPHVTPESRQTRPTKTPEVIHKPKPDLFQGVEKGESEGMEELDFQLDGEMSGQYLDFDGGRPTYESSEDEDDIPDDEVGHVVMLCKVSKIF